jgi:hypothetical protein
MIYFIISITVITLAFAFLYRARIITVCPICAGVVITWIAGAVGLYANQSWADPLIIAILLGASMGALADKYGSRFGLIWKSLMVLIGLPAIYFIVQKKPLQGLGLLLALAVITVFSGRNRSPINPHRKDLFKECC